MLLAVCLNSHYKENKHPVEMGVMVNNAIAERDAPVSVARVAAQMGLAVLLIWPHINCNHFLNQHFVKDVCSALYLWQII